MTKISDTVKSHFAGGDGETFWAPMAALLAQAAVERMSAMSLAELRQFVQPTESGQGLTGADDKGLEAARILMLNALL